LCKTREGDLDEFFKHENQACKTREGDLTSVSHLGKLRCLSSNKAELTDCLQSYCKHRAELQEDVGVLIIDGAALVNMLKPGTVETLFFQVCFSIVLALSSSSAPVCKPMPNTLPFFHAVTGCGTVPCFSRHGKNTAWATWKLFNNATDVFPLLSDIHCEVDDNVMETVERLLSCCTTEVARRME